MKNKSSKGKNNNSYIDGRTLKKYYCKEPKCNNRITFASALYGQGRCNSCAHKNKKHFRWIKGITKEFLIKEYVENKKSPQKIANEFGCSLYTIYRRLEEYNIPIRTWSEAQKIVGHKGKKNNFFGKHHTKENNEINRKYHKEQWQNKEFREKAIKSILKGFKNRKNLKPNKPEKLLNKLLNKLLPNEYKYVGNFKFWIENFNPDFINCNGQKKIIELFGDYWHNREDAKKRDKLRLKTYVKYGYKTLIIWEKELKNIRTLSKKLRKF